MTVITALKESILKATVSINRAGGEDKCFWLLVLVIKSADSKYGKCTFFLPLKIPFSGEIFRVGTFDTQKVESHLDELCNCCNLS